MYTVLTLNNISPRGLELLPSHRYRIVDDASDPDAILVRSHKMHDMALGDSLLAVARAGAGVNNIPVEEMSKRGIPVFNAPGANANAVKELVLAGMLMAIRNIPQALEFVRDLEGDDENFHKAVEAGKKKFAGGELPGRTLGVIGLGAIGVKVANAALSLGMNVVGYDPKITVASAWELSSGVRKAQSLEEVLAEADFVSLHVPLNEHTRSLIDEQRLRTCKDGAVLLNFSRDGIVDMQALPSFLDSGRIRAYVSDFPDPDLRGHDSVIALPHLGASTREAEENCAVMVVNQMREYLEDGNITNSVNFPEAIMPRTDEGHRMCIANANVPNMLGQISSLLAGHELNIIDMLNKSRGELAYTVVDVDKPIPDAVLAGLREIEGVLSLRIL